MAQPEPRESFYSEAEILYRALHRPGSGQISDAAEVSTNGLSAVFAGTMPEGLCGIPPTRICETQLETGVTRVMTFGPNSDRSPRFSPDGQHIAFLSDRHKQGDFQLYLLEAESGAARSTPRVDGWVEYIRWSPDSKRILLGVAGHGADVAGAQGAVTTKQVKADLPSWMPRVEKGDELYHRRRAWIYDFEIDRVSELKCPDTNIWEAAWCGDQAIVAVASAGAGEDWWYQADLRVIDLEDFSAKTIHAPRDQLGGPAASSSGRHVAIIEALCSDRGLVAGNLLVIETISKKVTKVDAEEMDVTYIEWCTEDLLLMAGHRDFDTVVGLYDITSSTYRDIWSSREISTGGAYVTVSGCNASGDFVLIGESFVRAPEIAVVRQGNYQCLKSFDLDSRKNRSVIASVEQLAWGAPDGLEIHGWLLRPNARAPYPLVMYAHGGPVWHIRTRWLGRASLYLLMLLERGYAVFFPNPRGSTGRGQQFARRVLGDMGGADTYDYLSGLDHLITQGVADPERLGVTGGSYGGFMTSWLITQSPRFAAAVSVSPVTNHVSQHLISNIPRFVSLFLDDHYSNLGGRYFARSPVIHAQKAKTPTLNICGALDRCTPPEEAIQFHRALLEYGVESVLITYPEEGHGIRNYPAAIDYTARIVAWFNKYMPPVGEHS